MILAVFQRELGKDSGERALARACAERLKLKVLLLPSICHLPDLHPVWKRLSGVETDLAVVPGIHPRPASWLLRARGVNLPPERIMFFDPGQDMEKRLSALQSMVGNKAEKKGVVEELFLGESMKERWYPVLDGGRCSRCGSCVEFCLFEVYARAEDGSVAVKQPDACKPGCPACSRICPEGAIMFPLYDKDPAIAGVEGHVMRPVVREQKADSKKSPPPQGRDEIDALIEELDKRTEKF